ncbi:MAG: hypothetical protein L3J83_09705 [Proteobacteria bacterium]|nr:hypothetical protein [Pseudomonadota bacterium]
MRKLISTLFSLLILASISFQTHAVQLSKSGMGQVLIFPYYTVNGDFNTLINLVNTTDQAKALRIRFREAANSREVFALNLYLGPHDTWVAALVKSGEGDDYFTKLINPDASCTFPTIGSGGLLFSDNKFTQSMSDFYGEDSNRMHEGFFEVIEMGVLTVDSAAATVINEQGVNNCDVLTNAWTAGSGDSYWLNNPNQDMSAPTGGIMGNATLINVTAGLAMSQPVTVLDDFSDDVLHFNVDSDSPSLADSKFTSIVDIGENSSAEFEWSSAIDAVSSVMMKDSIFNEYVLTDVIGAQTDWIMTLPTRQYYVDPLFTDRNTPVAPFSIKTDNRTNCEEMTIVFYDREAQVPDPSTENKKSCLII